MSPIHPETSGNGCRLTMTRYYRAPCALVWSVWTDPKHIARWWGPFGPDGTKAAVELKIGGVFFVTMTAPDGSCHVSRGIIKELEAPNRLVIEGDINASDACGAGLPPGALVRITFEEVSGGTQLTLDATFPSAPAREAATANGYATSWEAALDALTPLTENLCSLAN